MEDIEQNEENAKMMKIEIVYFGEWRRMKIRVFRVAVD